MVRCVHSLVCPFILFLVAWRRCLFCAFLFFVLARFYFFFLFIFVCFCFVLVLFCFFSCLFICSFVCLLIPAWIHYAFDHVMPSPRQNMLDKHGWTRPWLNGHVNWRKKANLMDVKWNLWTNLGMLTFDANRFGGQSREHLLPFLIAFVFSFGSCLLCCRRLHVYKPTLLLHCLVVLLYFTYFPSIIDISVICLRSWVGS